MSQSETVEPEVSLTELCFSSSVSDKPITRIVNLDLCWAIGLMAAATTIDPSPDALERWGRYFPQSTTEIISVRTEAEFPRALPMANVLTADRIRDILRYLGLTKTQLKDICSVSRQTLYDWLGAKFEPDASNATRLRCVHELALLVPKNSRMPIRSSLLNQPVLGGESLFSLLRMPDLHMSRLTEVVLYLAHQSDAAEKRSAASIRERFGFEKLEKSVETNHLEANLAEFEPS